MRIRVPYMGRGPGQLTIPGGATVFLFDERVLLPMTLLDPIDPKKTRAKKEDRAPSGIPLPPAVKPPTRPHSQPSTAAPTPVTPPPPYSSTVLAKQASRDTPLYLPNSDSLDQGASRTGWPTNWAKPPANLRLR
ncbi:hypothetical protein CRUP_012405 [Coryphaenoides rupestris]|nr:hypothetical protein CRUP_012405 [Coryphaenoides rupestris]